MQRVIAAALSLLFAGVALAEGPKLTTVILARHAEKANTEADTPLSAAGNARAKELARVLAGTRIDAVYTTQFARVRQTAEPLATAMNLTPMVMEAGGGKNYASDIVKRIRREHTGQTVLVVGHSNTTVDVLKELGVPNPPVIPEPQFDDLFVVTLADGAAPSFVALRYGAATR
jgi:broad specificity phosphatase PhoE